MADPATGSKLSTTKHWSTIVLLIVVPVLGAAGYGLWELHTPKPRIRTPVTITRNSLLPHRFAGVCENCHHIVEIGPVHMNKDNMALFRLTAQDRQLLMAGQSVEAPSLLQRLRVPAISRSDTLPHRYVGNCSNCHLILDVRPSREFSMRAMQRAYQPLSPATMSPERVERGGVRERNEREWLRNLFGFISLGLFLVAFVYVGMRFLLRTYPIKYKGKFQIKPWFKVHEWCSVAFAISATLHWHFSDRGNTFLHLALVLVIWLTLAGYVLRYRMAERELSKGLRLLHTQRWMFVALVGLLVVGHLFAEFY